MTRPPDGIEVHADAGALCGEWAELAAACGAGPLSHPSVALAWWEHLGRGELAVVTVRRDGRLVALAPLHRRRLGRFEVLRWLGHGLGTVAEMLVRPGYPDAAAEVWTALGGRRSRILQLTEYRHGGGGLLALRRETGWRLRCVLHDLCPVVDVTGPDTAHDLMMARRNLRRTVRGADRRLADAGLAHEVEKVTDPARLAAVLPEITGVFDMAEAARPRLHLLAGRFRPFTLAVLDAAASSGRLGVYIGRVDGHAVSVDVTLQAGDVVADWVGRHDPAARAWSPGHLLLRAILEDCGETGVRRLDLLVGDDGYKRRWATGTYDTLDVVAAGGPALLPAAGLALRGWERAHRVRGSWTGRQSHPRPGAAVPV